MSRASSDHPSKAKAETLLSRETQNQDPPHGNFGFSAELLFSGCNSFYTIAAPLLPPPLPRGDLNQPSSAPCLPPNIKALHRLLGWCDTQPRCNGRPGGLAAQLRSSPGGQSLPAGPLCSLVTPASKNKGPLVYSCCGLAKGDEGLFFYLYL